MHTEQVGKIIMILAVILLVVGGLLFFFGKYIGQMPGDIIWKRGNATFFFPVVACIIISVIGTILLNIFLRK